jgi:hypothetical protein
MQTVNGEGVVISADDFHGVDIEGNKNPKVRVIYNKVLDLDLQNLIAAENAKIADSLYKYISFSNLGGNIFKKQLLLTMLV